ncbi:MAG: hypothetical protein PW845_01335 [Pseudomonas sp.]|nr:hypothetical protein [Pseudomonas sp.]
MIGYPIEKAALDREIQSLDANWSSKAATRTQALVAQGQYQEASSIWSTVKPAYMKLQCNKCVFCERQFEDQLYGKIEFDLEHFRPKSSVVVWPDPKRHAQLSYTFATGLAAPSGYFWLAYEPFNYAASCKVCNSMLKLNFFPIAADRGASASTLEQLATEQPYLCYPIGNLDADPETLLTFVGTVAVPAQSEPVAQRRGQVIIDFFDLNREFLHKDRARMLVLFGSALRAQRQGHADDLDRELINRMGNAHNPHTNCLKAFQRLWGSDPDLAQRLFDECRRLVAAQA